MNAQRTPEGARHGTAELALVAYRTEMTMGRIVDPQKHLSRGMERRLREVQRADDILGKITPEMLLDLQRRREASAQPDGFKSGNLGSGGQSTSTESAALSGLSEDPNDIDDWRDHTRVDFIGASIEKALENIDVATKALRDAERYLNPVLNAASAYRERRSSIGRCQACGRDVPGTEKDRLRSGYCGYVNDPTIDWSGCYDRWLRQSRPDRPQYEGWVGEQLRAVATFDSHGYQVQDIDELVANGSLPGGITTKPTLVMLEAGERIYPMSIIINGAPQSAQQIANEVRKELEGNE